MFAVLRSSVDSCKDKIWWEWEAPYRKRDSAALLAVRTEHQDAIDNFVAQQFLFDRQWLSVKAYANERGVQVIVTSCRCRIASILCCDPTQP